VSELCGRTALKCRRQASISTRASAMPDKRNARTHSKSQIKQIAASIQAYGWTNPILVDECLRCYQSGGCCQSNGNSSPVRRISGRGDLALAHNLPPLSQGG